MLIDEKFKEKGEKEREEEEDLEKYLRESSHSTESDEDMYTPEERADKLQTYLNKDGNQIMKLTFGQSVNIEGEALVRVIDVL